MSTEKFKGKYRIDVDGEKNGNTRYATSDDVSELMKVMISRHKDKALHVFVYANKQYTQEEQNRGTYVESSFCNAVCNEIRNKLERNGH